MSKWKALVLGIASAICCGGFFSENALLPSIAFGSLAIILLFTFGDKLIRDYNIITQAGLEKPETPKVSVIPMTFIAITQ